jgi:hypothetical protein
MSALYRFTHEQAAKALYDGIERGYEGVELIDHILNYLEVDFEWGEDEEDEDERLKFVEAEIAAGRYTPPKE